MGEKISRLVSRASAVTAGNDYLAEFARQAGCPRVEVLPTSIDTTKYAEPRKTPTTEPGSLTIGWMGSRSTGPYLESLYPVIGRVAKDFPVRLLVVGHRSGRSFDFPVEFRDWDESREIADLQEMDIGIMPLPDTPWERGKCGYKLIQYMGVCKPVVASPVGVNATLVEHGINGFQAQSDEAWYEALRQLIENPELRESMGREGRARVEREYALDVNGPRLVQLLQEVVAD